MTWQTTAHSRGLSARRGRDTEPEIAVRRALRAAGFGYRLHPLIGPRLRADILVTRLRVMVFVDGCFWHQCPRHKPAPRGGPNARLWREKFERNRARDDRAATAAAAAGFGVVRAYECAIRENLGAIIARVVAATPPPIPERPL